MPIYEYRCSECGFEKDALQKMADKPLVDCPECGKPALVKLISAAGFQLKGSGWYATDFKGSGKPKETTKADTAAPKDGAKDGAAPSAAETTGGKTAETPAAKKETPAPSAPGTTSGSGD